MLDYALCGNQKRCNVVVLRVAKTGGVWWCEVVCNNVVVSGGGGGMDFCVMVL